MGNNNSVPAEIKEFPPLPCQEVVYKSISIEVLHKDMTKLPNTDVYCNSTNSTLDLETGSLARTLKKQGGDEFVKACKEKGTTTNGIAVTKAGNLNCKYVIHLDIHSEGNWKDKTLKVLMAAEGYNVQSIALAAFGTGAGGANSKLVADQMFDAISEFCCMATKSVKNIIICVLEESMLESFQMGELITLSSDNNEYHSVVNEFKKSRSRGAKVVTVQKVKNTILQKRYDARKQFIANERLIWHGTDFTTVRNIANTGFKKEIFKNGKVHGDGSYFGHQASIACTYAVKDTHGCVRLICAAALVGRITKSAHGMKTPPIGYNTGVDSESDPSMYIMFDDDQTYPKYIVTVHL